MALELQIKFRCSPELAARLARLAKVQNRKPADMARLGFEKILPSLEKEAGLKEITEHEVREIVSKLTPAYTPRSAAVTPRRTKKSLGPGKQN